MSLRQRLGLSADPVFLMDGSAYIFRGFYANQNMSRADGTPTNVLFMVLRLLLKILREESPAYFAFVLDGKGRNFRHRLYDDYKAHRLVTPEPLSLQVPPLIRAVRDLGLFLTVSDDCEADDCIAALAARLRERHPVVIIGSDKDLKQCLAPNVYIWDPSSKDEKLVSLDGFRAEFGFEPCYWPDYQAIVGDSSDNIPGVPGIGAKGAGTLMRDFAGLEDIFGRLAAVPPALRKKLEGNQDKALLSRRLTRLKLDCCGDIALEQLRPRPPRQKEIMDFLAEYELRSLSRELASMLRISGIVQHETGAGAELSLAQTFASLPGASAPENGAPAASPEAAEKEPAGSGSQAAQTAAARRAAPGLSGQVLAGLGQSAPKQICSGQIGPDQTGADQTGSDQTGAEQANAAAADLVSSGQGSTDLAPTDPAPAGREQSGQGQAEPDLSDRPVRVETGGKPAGEPASSDPHAEQGFLWGAAAQISTSEQGSLTSLLSVQLTESSRLPELADLAGRLETLPGLLPGLLSDHPSGQSSSGQSPFELPASAEFALFFARDLSGDKEDRRLVVGDGSSEFIFSADDAQAASLLASALYGRKVAAPEFKSLCEACPALRRLELADCFDLSLAAWLLNPEEYDYSFKKLDRHWGAEARAYLEQQGLRDAPPTALVLATRAIITENLRANNLLPLMQDMEMPLIPVLLDMQDIGLGIDRTAFAGFLAETEAELLRLTRDIHAAAGREFNIRSSKQLGDLLFEELKLPKSRKTGGGQASTSQDALERLCGKHPVVDKILEYRKLEKLRSTYLDPLPKIADRKDRLHTSFNQSSTATGRLSSSNPNLQNIPVRGPLGVRMRACFTAAPGKFLVSADYSQIELRVLAHLSGDPTLLDAFGKGEDIHRRTASLLFDLPQSEVTPDQRRNAKTINFGLVYGMGPQKLARELNISMAQAKEFIDRYFEKLVKLRQYFDEVEKEARAKGYVCTMTGRRRPCPEILSANQQLRSRARRQAINTCIQGSAADIIKLAMLAAAGDPMLKNMGARLILQIHDELLLECPPESADAVGARLTELMSAVRPGGQPLSVPLLCDWGKGRSWADAH